MGMENGQANSEVELVKTMTASAISSRHEAAAVLNQLAEQVSWGSYPREITPRQVGQALARAMLNCSEMLGDSLAEIVRGFLDYAKNKPDML